MWSADGDEGLTFVRPAVKSRAAVVDLDKLLNDWRKCGRLEYAAELYGIAPSTAWRKLKQAGLKK